MKTVLSTLSVGFFMIALSASTVRADVVVLGNSAFGFSPSRNGGNYNFTFHNSDGGSREESGSAGPIVAESYTSGFAAPKDLFCGDIHTGTSYGFDTVAGQTFALLGVELFGERAGMVQNLFNHTFGSLYDSAGNYVMTNNIAFQLALWEILEEPAGAALSLESGTFTAATSYTYETTVDGVTVIKTAQTGGSQDAINLANSWLASLLSSVWEENFNESVSREIFAFASLDAEGNINRNISQTMIGVNSAPSNAATPEPGTMLIFGVGLVGAALARRRAKKA